MPLGGELDLVPPEVEWVEELYAELRLPLRLYLQQFAPRSCEADDLVQEVFLRLLREALAGKRIERPRTWVFCVAHRLMIDGYRRHAVEHCWAESHAPLEARKAEAPDQEQRLLSAEEDQRMAAALSLLTIQERQCLELRSEGLRYREIGELLGLQVSTVASVVLRAIRKVARQINA